MAENQQLQEVSVDVIPPASSELQEINGNVSASKDLLSTTVHNTEVDIDINSSNDINGPAALSEKDIQNPAEMTTDSNVNITPAAVFKEPIKNPAKMTTDSCVNIRPGAEEDIQNTSESTTDAGVNIKPAAVSVDVENPAEMTADAGVNITPTAVSEVIQDPPEMTTDASVNIRPAVEEDIKNTAENSIDEGVNITTAAVSKESIQNPAEMTTDSNVNITPAAVSKDIQNPAEKTIDAGVNIRPAALSEEAIQNPAEMTIDAGLNIRPAAEHIQNTAEITTDASANINSISEDQINEFLDKNFPKEAELPNVSEKYFKSPKPPKRKSPTVPENLLPKRNKPTSSEIDEVTGEAAILPSDLNEYDSNAHVDIYTNEQLPQWYYIHPNTPNISKTIVPSRLPEAFSTLPIHGQPSSKAEMKTFWNNQLRDFVGSGLSDDEFSDLAQYCSPDHLLTGTELDMNSSLPSVGIYRDEIINNEEDEQTDSKLCIVNKYQMRIDRDTSDMFVRRLKYRGIRLIPLSLEDEALGGETLIPGKDLIFHFRIYRPFTYQKQKFYRGRHSVFCRDLIMVGRQKLSELRDSFLCVNDLDMRVDVSERATDQLASAKELFPSGFLFINNVFYVDSRPGCMDTSKKIRDWALTKPDLGEFPTKDLIGVRLQDLPVKLGHPEVYVHQGDCEHLFTVSEIRLVTPQDPLQLSQYPCHTAISQNQTVYCTTCAEFGAKFVVTGCDKVPFDPAFFCDTCLKLYLYKDGKKVCDFKAFSYRGNEMHSMKQQG